MRLPIMMLLLAISLPAFADDARFEQCREKLKAAQKLDVLYALDWNPPHEPYVVAGRTFATLRIDAKEGFAQTLNCFLMGGDESKLVNFDILDPSSGNPIARWSNGRLKVK